METHEDQVDEASALVQHHVRGGQEIRQPHPHKNGCPGKQLCLLLISAILAGSAFGAGAVWSGQLVAFSTWHTTDNNGRIDSDPIGDLDTAEDGEHPFMDSFALTDENNSTNITSTEENSEASHVVSTEEAERINSLIQVDAGQEVMTPVATTSKAPPRTTGIPYNEVREGRRYLLYNPSGCIGNQESELVNALLLSRHMGRTLLVPMVGARSAHTSGYNALDRQDLLASDRVYDFAVMQRFARVIPLNITVRTMMAGIASKYGAHSIRYVDTDVDFDGPYQTGVLKWNRQLLLFLSGKGMSEKWWGQEDTRAARRHVSYNPMLRRLSITIAQDILGPSFYAVHGQLGAEQYQWKGKTSLSAFVQTPEFEQWNKSLKCYLVSDDPMNAFFNDLEERVRIIMSRDLTRFKEARPFTDLFSGTNIKQDMTGVLHKLICCQAAEFLGTPFSSFSQDVKLIRATIKYVFPELLVNGTDVP